MAQTQRNGGSPPSAGDQSTIAGILLLGEMRKNSDETDPPFPRSTKSSDNQALLLQEISVIFVTIRCRGEIEIDRAAPVVNHLNTTV